MNRSLLLVALISVSAAADTLLKNEGTTVGPVTGLNCVGDAIQCTRVLGVGRIYVDAGGYTSGFNSGDQTKTCGDGGYITTLAAGTASVCAYVVAGGGSGTVTSVAGTQPIVITGTPTTTPTVTFNDDGGWRNSIDSATFPLRISSANINCSSATATDAGCLTAADWATFNAKGNGVVTSIGNGTNTAVTGTAAVPIVSLSGTVPQTLGGTGAGALTCGATERLTSGAGAYSCSAVPQGTVTSVSGTQPIASSGGATPSISFNDDGGWRNKIDIATQPLVIASGGITFNDDGGWRNTVESVSATGLSLSNTGTSLNPVIACRTLTGLEVAGSAGCLNVDHWAAFAAKLSSVSGTQPIVVTGSSAISFNDDGGWRNAIDSVTKPLAISSRVLSCSPATATDAGCLTASDWSAFSAKIDDVTGSSPISASCSLGTCDVSITSPLPIANGGTNAANTPTLGGVDYGTGTAHAFTAAGIRGQLLMSMGASVPEWTSAKWSWASECNDTAGTGGGCLEETPFRGPIKGNAGDPNIISCSWGTAGAGGSEVVIEIWNYTAGTPARVCACSLGACTTAALVPSTCTCSAGTMNATDTYVLRLAGSTDCTTNPRDVFCNVGISP